MLYKQLYDSWAFNDARILGAKQYKHFLVLQLMVTNNNEQYLSHLLLKNPYQHEIRDYTKDASITICINPKDRHDIYFPGHGIDTSGVSKINWGAIFMAFICIAPISIPILVISLVIKLDRKFQDVACISNNERQQNIWTISFENPAKIYISIFDLHSQTEILNIKERKDSNLDSLTRFFIDRQGKNVIIIGLGNTPVYDVYDAISYQKVSEIKDFEQNHQILSKGIASIENYPNPSKFEQEKLISILTNDGNLYYYSIDKNLFYHSEIEIKNYYRKSDSLQMAQNLKTFILPYLPERPYKHHQLYAVESKTLKGINALLEIAGEDDISPDFLNRGFFKHVKPIPLLKDKYFIKGKIVYFDFRLVVIQYQQNEGDSAPVYIDGYDINGKLLFSISEKDFPNIQKMIDLKETSYRDYSYYRINKENEHIIFMFKQYGAICLDLKTGEIVWNYEP